MKLKEQLLLFMSLEPGGAKSVAERAGVAWPQVFRFLKGDRSLALPTIEKLCEVMNLELAVKETPVLPARKVRKKKKSKRRSSSSTRSAAAQGPEVGTPIGVLPVEQPGKFPADYEDWLTKQGEQALAEEFGVGDRAVDSLKATLGETAKRTRHKRPPRKKKSVTSPKKLPDGNNGQELPDGKA